MSFPLSFFIAHRGAPQLAPENTLAALKMAKEKNARWVECDIQLTRDNQLVIFHDDTLQRTTNGRGLLSKTDFKKLETLDAGSWFSPQFKNERIPTLREWLQTGAQLKLKLNLEIKCKTKREAIFLAENVIDHLQKYWPAHSNSIFISSSHQFALMQVGERASSLPLGLIYDKTISPKEAQALVSANIISIHQPFKLFHKDYVAMLHDHGLHALAFTVNELERASALRKMGVDGVFTDNAALFQHIYR